MKDILAHWERLRADAAMCSLIRDLATDNSKRELYTLLAEHFRTLALEVERAITATLNVGKINNRKREGEI